MGAVVSRLTLDLEDVKAYLRVDIEEDDTFIESLIDAAKEDADAYLNNDFDAVRGESVGRGDGVETTYTVAHIPAYNITVYLNGKKTTTFTFDSTDGEIEFTTAPSEGVKITADYEADLPIPDAIRTWCLGRIARRYERRTEGVVTQSDPAGSVTWGKEEFAPIFRWRRNPGF